MSKVCLNFPMVPGNNGVGRWATGVRYQATGIRLQASGVRHRASGCQLGDGRQAGPPAAGVSRLSHQVSGNLPN
jgi:hypothetical protein